MSQVLRNPVGEVNVTGIWIHIVQSLEKHKRILKCHLEAQSTIASFGLYGKEDNQRVTLQQE